jgi:hypothetical protein
MIDQLRKLIKTVDPASATPADCRAMLDFVQAASEAREAGGGLLLPCPQFG